MLYRSKPFMGKTILYCSNVYPPNFIGGAELIAAYHAKTLQQMGHKPVVFTGTSESTAPRYHMTKDIFDGVTTHRIRLTVEDFDSRGVSFFHPEVDREFERIVRQYRPDIVHMHNMIGLSLGIIPIAKRFDIPTVLTLHDFWGFCIKNTLIDYENKICNDFSRCRSCQETITDGNRVLPVHMRNDFLSQQFKSVDAFISPSQYLADTYVRAGIPPHKMHVISNGVDVDRFARIIKVPACGTIRFTFIGYLGEHKGVQTIIDAVTLLKHNSALRLNIVGDGHLRSSLESIVQARGLSSMVRFWGKVEHARIEEVFRNTDVQILSSVWPENQPVSITESMACRTPVIATKLGGVPELVRDGITGFLVPPESAQDLAQAMRHFLERPNDVFSFGERGFESMKKNTLQKRVCQLVDLYERIGCSV
jgi:glycosyltransferase involved in cell wall biosynthesis